MVERVLKVIEHIRRLRAHGKIVLERKYAKGPLKKVEMRPTLEGNEISADLRDHVFVQNIAFKPDHLGDYFSIKFHEPKTGKIVQLSHGLKEAVERAGYAFDASDVDSWGLRRRDIWRDDTRVGLIASKKVKGIEVVTHVDVVEKHVSPLLRILFGPLALPPGPRGLPSGKS